MHFSISHRMPTHTSHTHTSHTRTARGRAWGRGHLAPTPSFPRLAASTPMIIRCGLGRERALGVGGSRAAHGGRPGRPQALGSSLCTHRLRGPVCCVGLFVSSTVLRRCGSRCRLALDSRRGPDFLLGGRGGDYRCSTVGLALQAVESESAS